MTKIPDFLVSTKQGVFHYKNSSFECLLDNEEDEDYYGITWDTKNLYCASPNNLYKINKKFESKKIDLKKKGIGDVHQILYQNNKLYLTNTEYNSVEIYNPKAMKKVGSIEIGSERKDVNHINSVFIKNDKLYICLHNKNKSNSEILEYTNKTQTNKLSDLGRMNHNIYIDDTNTLFTLDSKNGCTVKINVNNHIRRDKINFRQIAETYRFGRGLAKTERLFLLGVSNWAKSRKEREASRGFIIAFDNQWGFIDKIPLPVDAQVKDIRVTSESDLAHNGISYPL